MSKDNISKIRKRVFGLFTVLTLILGLIIYVMSCKMLIKSDINNTIQSRTVIRPNITDRNNILLATTILTKSLYIQPHKITDPDQVSQIIHDIVDDISISAIINHIKSEKKFILIKKHISKSQYKSIKRAMKKAKLEGVEILDDMNRIYPQNHITSHVIGCVNHEHNGIVGIERWLDNHNYNKNNHENNEVQEYTYQTSIDIRIQHLVHNELQNAMVEFEAEFAGAIIMDMSTGEILSIVSLPDFNPNQINHSDSKNMFNVMLQGIYEFGSSIKIITLAMLLENMKNIHQTFNVSKPIVINKFRIKDWKQFYGEMDIQEAMRVSSNIVFAKATLETGRDIQMNFFNTLCLFDHIDFESMELAKTIKPANNSRIQTIVNSYGYGFAITALHLLKATASILYNKQIYPTLTKLSETSNKMNENNSDITIKSGHFTSDKTNKVINNILKENGKTWGSKYISAIKFHGKTGTANMQKGGKYIEKQNIVSCVSVFPSHNPRYAIVVIIGHPKASKKTFGFSTSVWFTMPIIRNIINLSAQFLSDLKPAHITE